MAALMLSLLATQSSISLMIVFPFRDKWFYDELFELVLVFRFQKIRPVSSTELSNMYELGRPILSQLSTQKNPLFQLCFLSRVIVCTGKLAVQPWLSACPEAEKGGWGSPGGRPSIWAPLPSQASLATTLLSLLQWIRIVAAGRKLQH